MHRKVGAIDQSDARTKFRRFIQTITKLSTRKKENCQCNF